MVLDGEWFTLERLYVSCGFKVSSRQQKKRVDCAHCGGHLYVGGLEGGPGQWHVASQNL